MDYLNHLQLYLFKLPIEGQIGVLILIASIIFSVTVTFILYSLYGIALLCWYLIKLPFKMIFKPKSIRFKGREVSYAPKPNLATWVKSSIMPPEDLISSCFGIIYYKDSVILIKHISRGLEIPGGHKEAGESVLNCFKREISEECGVSDLNNIKLIAHQEILVMAPKPDQYKYPYPKSYQCVFKATAQSLDIFSAQLDSTERFLIPKKELIKLPIYQQYKFLFDS